VREAYRLREQYKDHIQLLIGFESEWIRPSTRTLVDGILQKHEFDLFIGSIHHVHETPIDFDKAMYQEARRLAGGTDERLFEDYFDAQFEMVDALKPPVIGHFDLIRLLSDVPDCSFEEWNGVSEKIVRNLRLIKSYGGVLEVNSSGFRKGLKETYPNRFCCKVICQKHCC
jgi:histidinol-phosphatase (PHP family)